MLPFVVSGYSFIAVAKSTAGRGNPSNLTATPDAPCVFCVFALVHLLLAQWFHGCCSYRVMVVRRGRLRSGRYPLEPVFPPPSGLPPVSVETPVVA
ncbi:ash family protein [Klebsiella pneumoniae]|uniref:Ash family protein n=1 Tax=Klebsiella pneumoniae TaxID=573 RepID=A0A923ENW3_KLEPN|nr:ash family protein [Klebsiella pneumoniae]